MALENRLQAALDKRQAILTLHAPTRTRADLFSNDYLSLASNHELRSRLLDRLNAEPEDILGSTGSRMLDGNTKTHVDFEERLRQYYNADAALLFNSGYDANLSLFGTMPQEGDVFVYDKLVHASIFDGFRLSRAVKALYPFDHNSAASLRGVLQSLLTCSPSIRSGSRMVYIAIESVYSMDGDVAPILELVETVEQMLPRGCGQIFVDESHSTGLYGSAGRGVISYLGLEKRVAFRLHTFSKTLASTGAVLLISPLVRTYLINFARPFIYSTSLTRICLLATEASLDIVEGEIGDQLRQRLFALTTYTIDFLKKELTFIPPRIIRLSTPKYGDLQTAMIPLLTPYAIPLCVRLRTRGWAAFPIIPPVVPVGEERIRFIVHAGNTEQDVRDFVYDVLECIREGNWDEQLDLAPGMVFDKMPLSISRSIARL